MPRYQIGNILRGHFTYEAPNDRCAWDLGCAHFNRAFPSQGGRHVYLSRLDGPEIVLLPQACAAQEEVHGSAAESDQGGESVARGQITLCAGLTSEPWPYDGDIVPDVLGVSLWVLRPVSPTPEDWYSLHCSACGVVLPGGPKNALWVACAVPDCGVDLCFACAQPVHHCEERIQQRPYVTRRGVLTSICPTCNPWDVPTPAELRPLIHNVPPF
jgi:hypothetical protein